MSGTPDDDAALFRAAIGTVTPLAERNRAQHSKPVKPARTRPALPMQPVPDRLSDFACEHAPDEYLRNGVPRQTLRKLRNGAIQDMLDLHGNTVDAARTLLQHFLFSAVQGKLRCVLVIHGKGMNSKTGEAVLRNHTRNWLVQHPQVLAFCAAPPEKGGSGAVMILLQKTGC